MYNVYKWIFKGIIFFSLMGMIDILFNGNCYFSGICAVSVIVYMSYRLVKKLLEFDAWGDINNPLKISYDNYEYLNSYEPNNNIVVYGSGSSYKKEDQVKELAEQFKLREGKIEVIETITKEIKRPLIDVSGMITPKPSSKKIVKKKEEETISIDPNEFNKELIMLVNDDKLSKDVMIVYDCIIKALKDCKYPSSMICTILQAFPYIDLCGNQVMIYINNRQIEGIVISKLKRKIITNINEKFENNLQTVFKDLKYYSVLDYFAKNNAL